MIGGFKKHNQVANLMHLGHTRTQAVLVAAPKRFYQMQRLHLQE